MTTLLNYLKLAIMCLRKDVYNTSWCRYSILTILFSCVLALISNSATMFNSEINLYGSLYFNLSTSFHNVFKKKFNFISMARNSTLSSLKDSDPDDCSQSFHVEKIYYSMEESKSQIYKDLKDKSGVYLLINRISGDSYVGSSLEPLYNSGMRRYYFETNSNSPNNLIIIRALRKYGISNFSLIILTFNEPKDHNLLLGLEQLALDLFKPNYNILSIAGSSSGFQHKEETILKLKQLQ